MIPLRTVLIEPRRVRRSRMSAGWGLVFAPAILWLLLSVLLRAIAP